MRARRLGLFVACTLLSSAAGAEEPSHPPVHPFVLGAGDKVRVWTSGAGALTAETAVITASDHTGMMVVVGERARLVPFETVSRLEVRRGRSWARRGALLGLGVGALAGSWFLADELADHAADTGDRVRQGLLLGAVGAAVGGLSGAALHPARWEPVSIESVRPRPAAAAGIGISVTF